MLRKFRKSSPSRHNQGGFTLVEFGIVMALAAVILFFVVKKLNENSNEQKAQNFVQEFTGVLNQSRSLYQTQPDMSAITMTALRDNGVFPDTWNISGTITSPFGGAITVAPATISVANDGATFTVPGFPSAVCSKVAKMMAGGVTTMSVAGTSVKALNANLDIAATGTQCSSAATVSMAFTIGKM